MKKLCSDFWSELKGSASRFSAFAGSHKGVIGVLTLGSVVFVWSPDFLLRFLHRQRSGSFFAAGASGFLADH